MRKVLVFEDIRHGLKIERKLIGEGYFHQFGVDSFQHETGIHTISTAIVEMENGALKNIPVDLIQFVTPTSKLKVGDTLKTEKKPQQEHEESYSCVSGRTYKDPFNFK